MRKASPEIRRRLSNNLKRLRESRCYTQEDLAEFSGLNKSYISNVEQATMNVTLASLEALAKGLDCDEEELLRRPHTRGTEPGGVRCCPNGLCDTPRESRATNSSRSNF
jgi:DNA-binding XRE family transcriptional regulator